MTSASVRSSAAFRSDPPNGRFIAPKEAVDRSATITELQSPHVSVLGVTVMALSPVSSQFADAQPNQAALPFSTDD
jgi:hypothetical protein